ncbi:NAD(P) transhydrogenase subunit alpha [Ferrimonas lipolytica]|uniref:NAD(P) transhydrogenase subunit alpha part 1 n=1 Tax=Ferrimonas lipolytica TaxID=2724191 RepID=A0A6H1UKI1_9GAMM|nr:NAD(P) transhydrogenase subunit alpha [Ferrimonas lipolytica]QIZ78736.1 NAD(P) transhydrogenase subunit alpha [Ferrimonas lipolytica]
MKIAVIKEIQPGETRVALIPANVSKLTKGNLSVTVETGAGILAGFNDSDYEAAGATIAADLKTAIDGAEVVLSLTGHGDALIQLLPKMTKGQTFISMMDPLASPAVAEILAEHGINGIALELVPRITRAQSMDVLSSNATIAGYKAVLMGAASAPQLFPMMMTAAGTLKPARVFIMGVGVAGLQACATAKRLGGVVEAYDIRPAAREQILSVGARPVELNIEAENTETKGGYAKEQSADFIARQQEAMADVLAQQDVVITTAAIPGRKAPVLITEAQLNKMKPGSIIVDLAAETGGNCAMTVAGETVSHHGVTIIGPKNVPASVPNHASQMFGTNLTNLLTLMATPEGLNWDFEDEIIRDTCVSYQGEVVNARLRELLDLPALPLAEPEAAAEEEK